MTIVGISVDEDAKLVREMAARTGMQWPQLCDGKGANGDLAKLFNASVPTMYLLDRDGLIAAKHVGFFGLRNLSPTIERLMPK